MTEAAAVRIGPAGWSYKDWEGIVYPTGIKGFDPLAYLALFFDAIEINSTFYRAPAPGVSRSWARRVSGNPRFRFAVKLLRRFTHERHELGAEDETAFRKGIEPLAGENRLGAILVQFPYSFHNTGENRQWVRELARRFHEYPLILEVRHGSWNRPQVFQFLQEAGVGFCNIDQPRVSYSIGRTSRCTASVGYLRLHGRNRADWFREGAGRDARYDYLYSPDELSQILLEAKRIASCAEALYVVTNNHFHGKAVVNALQMRFMWEGKRVRVPQTLLSHYPELEAIREQEAKEEG